MSDLGHEWRDRAAALGVVVVVGALSITAYFATRPSGEDAAPSPQPSSSTEATTRTAPTATEAASPADTSQGITVEPVGPADGDPQDQNERQRAPRAPGSAGSTLPAEHRTEEPVPAPSVEPVASAQPSASASAPAVASAVAPPPPVSAEKRTTEAPSMIGEFVNRASKQFKLLGVDCVLDGGSVYSGPGGASIELFRRPAGPGHHTVSVVARYQGNGGGVFSYFDGYKFTVRARREFTTATDAPTRITVVGIERGGMTTSFEDRLGLTIQVH